MTHRVQLFAVAKQLAGVSSLEVELPSGAKVTDLRRAIADASPPLEQLVSHAAVAINARYAEDECPIPADAEVALIPPVSGG